MNRDRIAKAAREASRQRHPPTREQVRAILAKGYPEFDDGQARGNDGRWTSGGGGGSGGGSAAQAQGEPPNGWQRAGRAALLAGGVLVGGTILGHAGRAASRALYARSLARRRAANTAWRRAKAETMARAHRDAQAAREARSLLGRMRGDLRGVLGRSTGAAQRRADHWDARWGAARRRAAARTTDKLPPKARRTLERATRRGADSPFAWLEF